MNDGKFINYYSIHATGLFLYPLKTSGFLMLSRGIKRDQWHEMGRYDKLCSCYRGTCIPLHAGSTSQLSTTCSKLTIKTIEQGVKYVQI